MLIENIHRMKTSNCVRDRCWRQTWMCVNEKSIHKYTTNQSEIHDKPMPIPCSKTRFKNIGESSKMAPQREPTTVENQ